jgi:DNA-binding transcriptional regulator YdaS (Cro superfamily)
MNRGLILVNSRFMITSVDTQAAFEKACRIVSSYSAVGALFDPPISAQAVAKWGKAGIPGERVIRIAGATSFKVRPHELRPDLYPHPDDGLPASMRMGTAAGPVEILEQLREVMTEEELRELTISLDQSEDVALGFVRGLAEKHRIAWTDTLIAQGLAAMAKDRRPS